MIKSNLKRKNLAKNKVELKTKVLILSHRSPFMRINGKIRKK